MWKKGGISRKAIILLFALLLALSVGGGFNKASADQGIQSRLTDWFDNRKNESISEMDRAISSEKNRLMDQLRVELQLEMQRAQAQLARHTAAETAQSIRELEEYAAKLSAGIHVSNDAEKNAVSSNLDAALEDAKAIIKGSAVVPKVPAVTQTESKPESEGIIDKPEVQKPVQESVQTPEVTPETKPEPEENPTSEASESEEAN